MPSQPQIDDFYDDTVGAVGFSTSSAPYLVATFNNKGRGDLAHSTDPVVSDPGFNALHEMGQTAAEQLLNRTLLRALSLVLLLGAIRLSVLVISNQQGTELIP